jgi:hypothetical protein
MRKSFEPDFDGIRTTYWSETVFGDFCLEQNGLPKWTTDYGLRTTDYGSPLLTDWRTRPLPEIEIRVNHLPSTAALRLIPSRVGAKPCSTEAVTSLSLSVTTCCGALAPSAMAGGRSTSRPLAPIPTACCIPWSWRWKASALDNRKALVDFRFAIFRKRSPATRSSLRLGWKKSETVRTALPAMRPAFEFVHFLSAPVLALA